MDERQLKHAHANHLMALRNFEYLLLSGEVSLDSQDGKAVLEEFREATKFFEGLLDGDMLGIVQK